MKKQEEQSRRAFLKRASVLAGAGVMASASPWLNTLMAGVEKTHIGPNDTIQVGVIGVGVRGSKLLQHLQLMDGVKITAVCDDYQPNYEKALRLTNNKAKGFYDYKELLAVKEIDAVIIATPVFLHPVMTIDALKAGKHVFVEKAMGINIPECKAIVDTQKETGLCLQVGHQRMFDLVYLEALRRVREGEFGPITHIRTNWNSNNDWAKTDVPPELEEKLNWRIYNKYSLGLMGELASHQIQVANWFLNEVPEYVVGSGSLCYWKDSKRDTFDHVNTIFKYPSGAHLNSTVIQTNWYYGLEEAIMGPKGNFELEDNRFVSQKPPPAPGILQLISDLEKKTFQTIPIGGASWIVEPKSNLEGNKIVNKYPLPDSTDLQFKGFIQSIRDNKPITDIIRQGYYASVGAIMGHEAMMKKETVFFKEAWRI